MIENLTLAEIRALLRTRESDLGKLRGRKELLLSGLADLEIEIALLEGKGGRGGRNAGRKGRKARTGRPPETAGGPKKPGRRGRPPKAQAEAKGGKPAPKKGETRKTAKPKGMSLADYAVQALEKAGGQLPIVELAREVEKLGYKSKNTPQVLRMTVGRKGKFVKLPEDKVKLA